jgi:hypothetical protein
MVELFQGRVRFDLLRVRIFELDAQPTQAKTRLEWATRRVLVEGVMGCRASGARIMMGMLTQPFRAGLTFSGRPSGP